MLLENSLLQQIPDEMITQLVVDEGYCVGYKHHYFWIFPKEVHDLLKLVFIDYTSYLESSLELVIRYLTGYEINTYRFLVQSITKEEMIKITAPILNELLHVFASNPINAVRYSVNISHERLPEHYERYIMEDVPVSYWVEYITYFNLN